MRRELAISVDRIEQQEEEHDGPMDGHEALLQPHASLIVLQE